jgi:hypothetical protein
MTDFDKMTTSIEKLQANSEYNILYNGEVDEALFNSITWVSINNLSWSQIQAEMDRLNEEYDNQKYARKRKAEYPSVQDLVVALYDTDDKEAIEAKRAEIKLKYPKP